MTVWTKGELHEGLPLSTEPGFSLFIDEKLVCIEIGLIWLFFVYILNFSFSFCGAFVFYQLFLVIVCTDDDFKDFIQVKC